MQGEKGQMKSAYFTQLTLLISVLAMAVGSTWAEAKNPRKANRANTPYADAAAYCRAKINVDYVRDSDGSPASYVGPRPTLAQGNVWRCMEGKVYSCFLGASGLACAKADASRIPSLAIRQFCRRNPNTDFVPMMVIDVSSSTWKCEGVTPVIIETFPLDARGYQRDAWKRID